LLCRIPTLNGWPAIGKDESFQLVNFNIIKIFIDFEFLEALLVRRGDIKLPVEALLKL